MSNSKSLDSFNHFMEKLIIISVYGLVMASLFAAMYCLAMSVTTPPTWQYCYITEQTHGDWPSHYLLEASVDWGHDPDVASSFDLIKLEQLAELHNCPLRSGP